MTVTPDLPKIYLFDVEINENIFQIKEKKGGEKVGINSTKATLEKNIRVRKVCMIHLEKF